MKYTLVTETFPPEINGVARTLQRLVTGIAERDHDCEVIRPRQSANEVATTEPYSELLVPGCPIPRYPGLKFGLPAYNRLTKHWRENRPNTIHVATEGPLGVTAILVARKLGIPVWSSFHTNFHTYGKHYGYGFLISTVYAYLRWVHNMTLGTFAPSDDVVRELKEAKFDFVFKMARGVDTVLFDPARRDPALRESWGAADKDPVVVYVGRIAGEKNIPLLVRAFEAMKAREPAMKLVLVGDGPERARLERMHKDFIFVGPKVGEELASYYASGDLFLFGSVTETFGNVVTEAMASGLVVLAYDYAAPQKHIEHGVNGFKVPFNDEKAFINEASAVLEKREEWPRIAQAARETTLSLSWDTIVDDYLSIIQSV